MEQIIKYKSILGREFNTKDEAIKDEDRLVGLINIYENDLLRFKSGKLFLGETEPTKQEIENCENAILRFKEKWETVQLQRHRTF
jgi:hypothetical protein